LDRPSTFHIIQNMTKNGKNGLRVQRKKHIWEERGGLSPYGGMASPKCPWYEEKRNQSRKT